MSHHQDHLVRFCLPQLCQLPCPRAKRSLLQSIYFIQVHRMFVLGPVINQRIFTIKIPTSNKVEMELKFVANSVKECANV